MTMTTTMRKMARRTTRRRVRASLLLAPHLFCALLLHLPGQRASSACDMHGFTALQMMSLMRRRLRP